MTTSHFFANLARLKLIYRWPLMRSVNTENVQEHSHQVATVAHMLALIKNKKFGGQLNPEKVATIALYHDVSEVITGDMPTPIKYFNDDIAKEYKKIESLAEKSLVQMVPKEFQQDFVALIQHENIEPEYREIVKNADILCSYLKTLEELSAGNHEFEKAKQNIYKNIQHRLTNEMQYFLDVFVPSFSLNLDEISGQL